MREREVRKKEERKKEEEFMRLKAIRMAEEEAARAHEDQIIKDYHDTADERKKMAEKRRDEIQARSEEIFKKVLYHVCVWCYVSLLMTSKSKLNKSMNLKSCDMSYMSKRCMLVKKRRRSSWLNV